MPSEGYAAFLMSCEQHLSKVLKLIAWLHALPGVRLSSAAHLRAGRRRLTSFTDMQLWGACFRV